MKPLEFAPSDFLSLGVELELQLIDPHSLDLTPAAPRLLERLGPDPAFKPEFFKTMVELCSPVCQDLPGLEASLLESSRKLARAAQQEGLLLVGTGTHPFSGRVRDEDLWDNPRYQEHLDLEQWIGRHRNVFGLHVHLGARGGEHAVALMRGFLPYLAPLLALSASSPFLFGQDTGLASVRATAFESKPNCGLPPALANWERFQGLVRSLQRAGAIHTARDLHWDVRPSPGYGTLEVRICDGQAQLRQSLALVALMQGLAAWIDRRLQAGQALPGQPAWLLRENKWRALRWGMEADLIVDSRGRTRSVREVWRQTLERIETLSRTLGSRPYLEEASRMLEALPGPQAQREQAREGLPGLVRALAEEWRQGVEG